MTSFSDEYGTNGRRPEVTGGLMQELEEHEDGISRVFDAFEHNGMTEIVERWASGETQLASVRQMEKGFRSTSIVENVAKRLLLSHGAVLCELAILIPILVHHFVLSGFVSTNEASEYESTVQQPNMMLAAALDRVA